MACKQPHSYRCVNLWSLWSPTTLTPPSSFGSPSFPNSYTFNLKDAIPYHSLSDEDRKTYWDDGVHLTGDGYAWMADHIADALIEYIKNDI